MDMLFKIILFAAITLFSVEAREKQLKVIRPPTDNIKRPCPNFDIKCIQKEFIKRNWFGDNVGNQPEGPLIIKETVTYPMPYFKVTSHITDTVINGLEKGKVTEFCINKYTDKAVLSCEYDNVVINSSGIMDIHRAGKENINLLMLGVYEKYNKFLTTTVITGLNGPPVMATHIDEYELKILNFGDGVDKIKDKDVKHLFKQIEKHRDIGVKEANIQRADSLQKYFINNVIGKGLPPIAEKASSYLQPSAFAFATATAGAY